MVRLKQHRKFERPCPYQPVIKTPYLTDDVLENIFSFLPIKNAVNIGVLSKRFQKSWLKSRRLIFDRYHVSSWGRDRIKDIVGELFNLYAGSKIQCFKLFFDPHNELSIVESWVKKCIEKGVEELDLDFFMATRTVIFHDGFFDIQSLKILKLNYCHFNLPPKLTGLSFLNTLILRSVHLANSSIETIISNCLCLETLDMVFCSYITDLKIMASKLKCFKILKVGGCSRLNIIDIDSPTLCSFYYYGKMLGVLQLVNVEKLSDVMLNLRHIISYSRHAQVLKLVDNLSKVSVLTATSFLLEGISLKFMDEVFRFEYCFWNLKELQLLMGCANFCNMFDIIVFIRHCPMLEKIFMNLGDFTFECGEYWKLHQQDNLTSFYDVFDALKVLKIKGFKFQKMELAFVSYMLKKAIKLDKLVLVSERCTHKPEHIEEISKHIENIHCCKTSLMASIEVYGCFDNEPDINPTQSHRLWD